MKGNFPRIFFNGEIKMKYLLSLLIVFSFSFQPPPPDKPAYRIFTKDAVLSSYSEMMDASLASDLIFFGELHNNPIAHWLEIEMIKSLDAGEERSLKIGTEMFDSDKQGVIDEYLLGLIREKDIATSIKTPSNYKTDYLPILRYAKENNIPFFATNIPRRYASKVAREGFSALDSIAKIFPKSLENLPSRPIEVDLELPLYKEMDKMGERMKSHGMAHMTEAQVSKDATMSGNILKEIGDGQYFHFNGSYHTKDYEGIIWFINKARPGLKIISITTVEQDNLDTLDSLHQGTADFIIVIPSAMTKTY